MQSDLSFFSFLSDTLTTGFSGNIISGIIASILTLLFLKLKQILWCWWRFANFSGQYETFTLEGERIKDEVVTVKWVGSNMIFAQSQSQDGSWESYITMDNTVPNVGDGYFQYKDRIDYGTHQIQRNITKDAALVFAYNPALPTATAAYMWKRKK